MLLGNPNPKERPKSEHNIIEKIGPSINAMEIVVKKPNAIQTKRSFRRSIFPAIKLPTKAQRMANP